MSGLEEAVAAAKSYLRIEGAADDALLATLAGAALAACEAFIRQTLIVRQVDEYRAVTGHWTRLARTPVRSIAQVQGLGTDGVPRAIPVGAYTIDIDANGDGWVRIDPGIGLERVVVTYQAGMASDWAGLPAAIPQGVSRLVAYLYTQRDAAQAAGPPAAVAALWRPWRRMDLR